MGREIDEAWVEEAIERYRRIESLQDEFDRAVRRVEVTVRSPDGVVELAVAASGAITGVRFLVPLQTRTNNEVAGAVLTAAAAAADAARWAREKLHAETFGDYPGLAGA